VLPCIQAMEEARTTAKTVVRSGVEWRPLRKPLQSHDHHEISMDPTDLRQQTTPGNVLIICIGGMLCACYEEVGLEGYGLCSLSG